MNTKMYVGNLPLSFAETEVGSLFAPYGPVTETYLPIDRSTGLARGFAFVTLDTVEGMQAAIQGLDGKSFGTHALTVNEARPHEVPANSSGVGRGGNRIPF